MSTVTVTPHLTATPPALSLASVAAHAAVVAAAPAAATTTGLAAEVNRIEAALSLALHSVQTQYDADLAKVKSAWSYVKANVGKLLASHAVAAALGSAATFLVKHFI